MMKKFTVNNSKSFIRRKVSLFLTGVLITVPYVGLAADLSDPIIISQDFTEDTRITSEYGICSYIPWDIEVNTNGHKLTFENSIAGISLNKDNIKINIKAEELNIVNAKNAIIGEISANNNQITFNCKVNIINTKNAIDDFKLPKLTLNFNNGLYIKDISADYSYNSVIELFNHSKLNATELSIENFKSELDHDTAAIYLGKESVVECQTIRINNINAKYSLHGIEVNDTNSSYDDDYPGPTGIKCDLLEIKNVQLKKSDTASNLFKQVNGIYTNSGFINAKQVLINNIDASNQEYGEAYGINMQYDKGNTDYLKTDNVSIDNIKAKKGEALGISIWGQTLSGCKDNTSIENVSISNVRSDSMAYGFGAGSVYGANFEEINSNVNIKNLSISNIEAENSYGLINSGGSIINVDNNTIVKNLTDKTLKIGVGAEDRANTNLAGNTEIIAETALFANKSSIIDVNSSKKGTVWLTGKTDLLNDSTINAVLNNVNSYWNLTDDSKITSLELSENALLDMSQDKGKFSTLTAKNITGNIGKINMDIDASTTNKSDRIYVTGEHTGTHYITLNNTDGNTDGAAGTVLVSVKDEQGNFFANDKEGSLYWNKYTLDMQDSATDGYTKDWYLKKVEFIPSKPTTSVDAVDATQRLAFANWVEDDKLMQRMGDLRHETNNEEGVWVRVKGGKYSGDGFSNRHTMYQLGYDDVVKENEKLKRYQGVAFAYDDGKNSFNRGSGKLKAKSIGFYNTDLRNKGHYLDVVFKIYDADSDFTVFDSEGKKITGAFDNTGISLSAEYGRKKYLDEHWSIEPQAQLTLGYLGGARYTTSNGIHVSQSDPNSVLGRIGCNFMYDMDEKNTVYLKANWLHQFAGNYGATLTNGNDSLRIDNHDHDTWFEYGLGFACMTGKNNHLYADVERSTGGSLRKNWQWNAGMFWTF